MWFFHLFCVWELQSGFWGQPYALNLPESYCAASQNPGSFTLLQVRRKNDDRIRSYYFLLTRSSGSCLPGRMWALGAPQDAPSTIWWRNFLSSSLLCFFQSSSSLVQVLPQFFFLISLPCFSVQHISTPTQSYPAKLSFQIGQISKYIHVCL